MTFWKQKKPPLKASPEPPPRAKTTKKTKKRSGKPVPFEIKAMAMEAIISGADRGDVAQVAGVQPCTIDRWLNIYKHEGLGGLCSRPSTISASKVCRALEERIIRHRQENPDHGVRRVHDELRNNEALDISPEKIRQVVNGAGLGGKPVKSKRRPPQIRRFERKVPNAMWQIDIFTFELKRMYKAYLIGIIDDHSRYMVGWGLFRQQTATSVLEVVKGAIGEWGAPAEILSDNGRQFVAWRGTTKFQKVLKQQGIQHVRSAPRHPMTLGKIERFWQTIWKEFLYEATFASFADACQRVDNWMAFYNHKRPHQGIGGACPADRFYGMANDIEMARSQGCRENSERLALGQEPKPPLYLFGRLGGTDVRVVRKGEDIELKVGESIHEVARLSADMEGDHVGTQTPEMAEPGRSPEVRSGRAGPQTRHFGDGPLQDVRRQPADLVPGDGPGGQGCDRGVEPEASWTPCDPRRAEGTGELTCPEQTARIGSETGTSEERGGSGDAGTSPEGGTPAEDGEGEKNRPQKRHHQTHEWL